MVESIILPAGDAEHIASLLRKVDDDGEAEFFAEYLEDHAENHSFDYEPLAEILDKKGVSLEEFLAENSTTHEI